MYVPKHFQVTDREQLNEFIKQHSFGILFSQTAEGPYATHLPFFLRDGAGEHGVLTGHMARANPHSKGENEEVLVVFSGPHTYISPTWYQEPNTVPTWNYTAVHVYGKLEWVEEPQELRAILGEMTDFYEAGMPIPWRVTPDNEYVDNMLKAIVGFTITITRIEGKWKLSQNRPVERQERVVAELASSADPKAQSIAKLMQANIEQSKMSHNE